MESDMVFDVIRGVVNIEMPGMRRYRFLQNNISMVSFNKIENKWETRVELMDGSNVTIGFHKLEDADLFTNTILPFDVHQEKGQETSH